MIDGSPTLLSLPDELITTILTFCSAEDILNLDTTCKALHQRCQDRAVWLSSIKKLPINQAPDLPPTLSLSSFSALDLKKKLVNALGLAHRWRTEGSLKVARRAELRFDIGDPTGWVEPRLLPGRKEMLMENQGVLELWSLEHGKCIWTAPEDKECFSFDCELIGDGSTLNIAGVFSSLDQEDVTLRVFSYDFNQHVSRLVLERHVPNAFLSRYMIRGELFSAIIPFEPEIIVINWKTGEGVMVRIVDSQVGVPIQSRIAVLASEYLVSFLDLNVFASVAIPVSALGGHWSASENHENWETVTFNSRQWSVLTEADFNSHVFADFPNGPWVLSVHEFKPTWMDNAPSEMFVAACDRIQRKPDNFVVFHLRLRPHEPGSSEERSQSALTFEGKSIVPATYMPFIRYTLSNAGRLISLQTKITGSSLFNGASTLQNYLQLDEDVKLDANISVEPWSNAIVVGEPGRVRVFYLV